MYGIFKEDPSYFHAGKMHGCNLQHVGFLVAYCSILPGNVVVNTKYDIQKILCFE